MKINKNNALKIWERDYGNAITVKDFSGNIMNKKDYGKPNNKHGWNIHHVKPKSLGGTNEKNNLVCTNIITNIAAGNKTTYKINSKIYQIKRGKIVSQKKKK
jgi:hypothetical protein